MEHSNLEDYEKVRAVLSNLTENWRDQPSLEELAEPVGMNAEQLQRVFTDGRASHPKPFCKP